MNTVDVHIFSPGTQTSAQGVTREFTKNDLQQVAESYTPDIHEAPLRVGHDDNDRVPSWGWVKGVKMKGEDLYAEVEFTPQMAQFVKDGLYRKVSASFYAPESKINPEPGKWSLRHVAMLGAQPPAVKGLKGFAYTESDDNTFDFDEATGQVKLTPEQVFDEELGPTLKSEKSPLQYLQDEIEEARTEMAAEAKEKAEAKAQTEEIMSDTDETSTEEDTEFAEEGKMKKKASGKQGAEDAEEEVEGDGEDTVDNASSCGGKKKKGASYKEDEDEDDVQSKEKKMDPVGKEDSDVDNDGDSDSSDEYLKKRRAAIKKSMKDDTSDNSEEVADHKETGGGPISGDVEMADGEGPVASKVKKNSASGKSELDHSEIAVPEGVDAAQWEAGFKDAVDKYYSAAQEGADEVVHEEAEDQTADYLAGIEAGFEFAQVRLNRDLGSAKHDDKCCDEDEEAEGQGPVASKTKKRDSGKSEADPVSGNNFQEATFEPGKKKRGHDSDKSSDVGVKADSEYEENDDEQHGENNDFGRDTVGKAKKSVKRKEKGTGKSMDDVYKGDKSAKHADVDRDAKGSAKPPKQDGGKSKDVQDTGDTEYKSLSNGGGSGKAIKSPAVRVMKFSETQFNEMNERLEQLEALNAKLVQEKQAAERKAHRMQLEEFSESLYASGRLTDAVIDQEDLTDYMEGLENGTLEFAEGESPATKLMELLAALPAQVSFSEIAANSTDEVAMEDLNPHEQALRLSKEEGLEYTEALKQTLFSGT